MSNENNDSNTLVIAAILLAIPVIYIQQATNLSFKALGQLAINLLLFGGGLWAVIRFQLIPNVFQYWSILLAILWLTFIPALNEWGTTTVSAPKGPLGLLTERTQLEESEWYAETTWQVIVAIIIASSKYVISWVSEKIKN